MKKLIQRLLLFIIALPLIVVVVLFLPYRNCLAANVIVVVLSGLGAGEFADMLNKKSNALSKWEACILGALGPAAMTLRVSFGLSGYGFSVLLMAAFAWLILSGIFTPPEFDKEKTKEVPGGPRPLGPFGGVAGVEPPPSKSAASPLLNNRRTHVTPQDAFKNSLNHIISGFAVIIYPGFFMLWIILMAHLLHADMVILGFFFMVVASDSVAWAIGMLFGANNRGIIPASPNKSVAGFIGGFAGSILVGLGVVWFFPAAFTSNLMPSLWAGVILGFISAAAASLGDLAESVMKRSSAIKDSGGLVPGRGGVLDSIDSIAMAAPVYFGLYRFLFM